MQENTKRPESIVENLTKMVETKYSWDSMHGTILLQETKDYIAALADIGYSEEEIIAELLEDGNISHKPDKTKPILHQFRMLIVYVIFNKNYGLNSPRWEAIFSATPKNSF